MPDSNDLPLPSTEPLGPRSTPPLRALVAEDNLGSARLAARLLERMGYAVEVVLDGQAAITAALREAYALVLLDCQLPDTDGFEVARTILEQSASERPLLIGVTASLTDDVRARCLEIGMDACLLKPLDVARIEAVIRRATGDGQGT